MEAKESVWVGRGHPQTHCFVSFLLSHFLLLRKQKAAKPTRIGDSRGACLRKMSSYDFRLLLQCPLDLLLNPWVWICPSLCRLLDP